MPVFERAGVSLYYEEYGSGYPLLLFAPGGMRSSIDFWRRSPFDPTAELAQDFRVIAMDQRNAGRSRAPISAADGWETYAADHLALLDHLGARRAHVLGGCIGSSYCLGLIKLAPERVSAAVLQNPIGLSPENRTAFHEMFDGWASELSKSPPRVERGGARCFSRADVRRRLRFLGVAGFRTRVPHADAGAGGRRSLSSGDRSRKRSRAWRPTPS